MARAKNPHMTREQLDAFDAEIGPCPFCRWEKAKLNPQRVGTYRRTGENYQVVCNKCRARGPLKDAPQLAVDLWNAGNH